MHRHIWVVDKEEVLPSGFEQLAANIHLTKLESASRDFFHKPVIVTRHCSVCNTQEVVRV